MDDTLIRVSKIVASYALVGVVLNALGVPLRSLVVGLTVAGVVTIISFSRPSARQGGTVPASADGEAPSTDTVTTFTNVAFSRNQPTWKGWSRDIGVVTITPEAISMVGKKNTITIDAPFVAELYDHKFLHWTMVRVTRSINAMPPATVYLVVRGAPRTVAAVEPEVVTEESINLVEAINVTTYSPSGDHGAPAQEGKKLPEDAWFCIHCRNVNEDPELARCSNCDRRRSGFRLDSS
ncbi:MAG: hypothetical protein ACC654_02375 [Acidimicrobiia bacterium]